MLKKISIAIFWLAFFGFFLYKLIPKYKYLSDDTLKHWGSNSTVDDNSIFALHIFAGIVVYCTAILQFTPTQSHLLMSCFYKVNEDAIRWLKTPIKAK